MLIQLTVSPLAGQPNLTGTFSYTFEQDEVLVGRDPLVDVRLPHPTISLVHLKLLYKKGCLWAVDMGSTNGTKLNGRPLISHEPVQLSDGTRLILGVFELKIGPSGLKQSTRPDDTAAFARQMVLEILGAIESSQHPFLEIKQGLQSGTRLVIPTHTQALIIGRGEGCDLQLNDADASRKHLEVYLENNQVMLRDLGSKNGFQVNGQPRREAYLLHDGDLIQLGQTVLGFTNPIDQYLQDLQEKSDAPPEHLCLKHSGPDRGSTDAALSAVASAGKEAGLADVVENEQDFPSHPSASLASVTHPPRSSLVYWLLITLASALIMGSLAALGYVLF